MSTASPRPRTAVVAGVGSDLADGIATALAKEGWQLALGPSRQGGAQGLAKQLSRSGHRVVGVDRAVTTQEGAVGCVERALDAFGALDLLVTCPGLDRERPMTRIDEEVFRALVEEHLASTFFSAQAAASHLVGRGGAIVCVTGAAGLGPADFGQSHLASVVGGVCALTRGLAVELLRRAVTVNAIALSSPPQREAPSGETSSRRPEAGQAAALIAFLASSAARQITGQVVLVRGKKLSVLRSVASPGVVLADEDWVSEEIARRWSELAR